MYVNGDLLKMFTQHSRTCPWDRVENQKHAIYPLYLLFDKTTLQFLSTVALVEQIILLKADKIVILNQIKPI
jgi:hypothetical protein